MHCKTLFCFYTYIILLLLFFVKNHNGVFNDFITLNYKNPVKKLLHNCNSFFPRLVNVIFSRLPIGTGLAPGLTGPKRKIRMIEDTIHPLSKLYTAFPIKPGRPPAGSWRTFHPDTPLAAWAVSQTRSAFHKNASCARSQSHRSGLPANEAPYPPWFWEHVPFSAPRPFLPPQVPCHRRRIRGYGEIQPVLSVPLR